MNSLKKPKLLIFGSTGFIGKNFISFFSNDFDIVVFLRKPISDDFNYLFKSVKVCISELTSENLVRFFQMEKPNFIINLISHVTADRLKQNFSSFFDSNVHTVEIILRSIVASKINISQFIQLGSTEEYGNQIAPFKEDMIPLTNSIYGLSKLAATNLVQMFSRENSIPSIILRPSNLFGKYQSDEKIIPYIISSIKKQKQFQISNLEKLREFYSVIDLLHAVKIVMRYPEKGFGEILNLGYGKGISLLQLINLIENEIGNEANFIVNNKISRVNEPQKHYVSIEKFHLMYGVNPFESNFEKRLSEFIKSSND